ncbi:MAG: hypothetical protein JWM96_1328, partial [Alphaproteobacteria bacterium]|nr:hypothetical protein [Alphaproteobacteria bacterium]
MIRRLLVQSLLGSVSSVLLMAGSAYAGPDGGVVSAGNASIAGQGSAAVNVTQSSDRVVIDWNSFDTQAHESVQFSQPGTNSIALNRITNGPPTQFNGSLQANGHVIVMNPNGVVFGQSAKVDVNGLIATTADIDKDRFMQEARPVFDKAGNPDAAVINNGQITAKEAGLVGFVAPHVVNNGTIEAKLGKVQLASGDSFTLDLYGDGLVAVKASDAINSQLAANAGTINTQAGTIQITAAQAKDSVDALILNTGTLNATSASEEGGKIILSGSAAPKGKVIASGSIKATGTLGGTIQVTGRQVGVKQANIDASGTNGGGTIRIGGGYQGGEGIQRAETTTIDSAGTIRADATDKGNGGSIVVWADGHTDYNGSISARGGEQSGDGGFAEVSGKNTLNFNGHADLSATKGEFGTLLLDPTNITISTSADSNVDASSPYQPNADDAVSNLNTTTLQNALSGANVIVQTRATGSQAGNITVSDAIIWGAATSLSLVAHNNIYLNGAISGATLNLTAPGSISQTQAITTTNLSLSGAAGIYTLTNASNAIGTVSGNTGSINLVNGNNNLSLGTVNSISGITSTGNTTLNSGTGTITTTQAIAVGSSNLTLSSNDLFICANISGTCTLTLQHSSTNSPIRLNFGSAD